MVSSDDISNHSSCFQFCNPRTSIPATSSMDDLSDTKINDAYVVSVNDYSSDTDSDMDVSSEASTSTKGIIESIIDLFGGFLPESKPPFIEERRVHFDHVVKVVLIGNRFEYLKYGLIPKLWYFEEDYTAARLERIEELKQERALEMLKMQSKLHAGLEEISNTNLTVGNLSASACKNEKNMISSETEEDGRTDIDSSQSDSSRFSDFSSSSSDSNDILTNNCLFCGGGDDTCDEDDDYYVDDLSPVCPVKHDANFVKRDIIEKIEKSICENNDNNDVMVVYGVCGSDSNKGGSRSFSKGCGDDNLTAANMKRCQTFRIDSKENIVGNSSGSNTKSS